VVQPFLSQESAADSPRTSCFGGGPSILTAMSFANAAPATPEPSAPEIFAAVLTPHRSLGSRGFLVVMIIVGTLSFAVGTTFYLLGAWPVPGFLSLDVLAVYLAFRWSYRSARAREEIRVSRDRLTVRHISPTGRASVTEINPYWARLELQRWPPFGITRLAIASHGKALPIGTFLGSRERERLAAGLSAALARARAAGPA
jgi:uncharacterized membrane protein